MTSDEEYMQEALNLAKEGAGKTSPNPAVGCILVKNGKIVGSGYHKKAGEAHAEVNALAEAGDEAKGATMYVTLEPCNHHGRTPPCTEAIVASGVSRVVAAMEDPNPGVLGGGLGRLREAGIKVEAGVMEKEARKMNEMYEKFVTTGRPFVIAKAALSADGKMAARDGSSKWITGEEARRAVQEIRSKVDAIMVGIGTVLKDNPSLTCRLPGCESPLRIVVDSKLRIPDDAGVLDNKAKTLIATTNIAPMRKIESLRKGGAEVIVVASRNGMVDLKTLLLELASEGITSVLLEGGGALMGSAFDESLVDKVMFFIAPKLLGGEGLSIGCTGVRSVKEAMILDRAEMKKVGGDFLLLGYPRRG